jgi:hypothetical protein
LSAKRWQVEIARFALASANRLPDRAAQTADGYAYMLLGVEPQNLCGVARVDNADLENGIGAYTGRDGPHWSPEYVEIDGVDVLLVTIAPPKAGDRIYSLAKDFDRYRNGDVFVRASGRTDRATRAELRQLEERLLSGHARPQLDVDVVLADPSFAVAPIDLSEASMEEWIELERRHLERPEPTPAKPVSAASDAPRLTGLAAQFAALRKPISAFEPRVVPEDRKPEDYDTAVNEYLDAVRAGMRGLARLRAVLAGLSVLRLVLENRTADNYEEVAVELHLPGDVRAYESHHEAEVEVQGLPSRPRRWGPRTIKPHSLTLPDMTSIHRAARFHTPTIRNDGSATITYPVLHLRPEAIRPLDRIFLVAMAGPGEIAGTWQATSKSVSGVARGNLTVPMGEPISLRELFMRPAWDEDNFD